MKVWNLYADEQGESHWREIDIDYTARNEAGAHSDPIAVTTLIFRRVQPSHNLAFHTSPVRRWCVNLDAGVEITTSDGEVRVMGAGEIYLVEDTAGKGHSSRAVDGKVRNCLFINLEDTEVAPLHFSAG